MRRQQSARSGRLSGAVAAGTWAPHGRVCNAGTLRRLARGAASSVSTAAMRILIERRFVRIASGLVHLRSAGEGERHPSVPLLLAHSSPGSSVGLVPMLQELGASRTVLAADMLGSGDSEAHASSAPRIADFADDAAALLDAMGIERVDFYGQHTGAQVGIELALRHPSRVRRVVLDGVALFPADWLPSLQAHYAPPKSPDGHGGHLMWAWSFVRELVLHFPHFMQDPGHRLNERAVPPPETLHRMALDLLKSLPTYHLAYDASFAHAVAERLALLRHHTLVMAAEGDPLERYLESAAGIVAQGPGQRVSVAQRASAVRAFLDT